MDPGDLAVSDPFIVSERLERSLRRAINARRAECVAREGFTADAEAQDLLVRADDGEERGVVSINPAELGPLTVGEARTYGLVGIDAQFGTAQAGLISSDDPAFVAAMRQCEQKVAGEVGAEIFELLDVSLTLRNEAVTAFRVTVGPALDSLIGERMVCFADRVGVTSEELLRLGDWSDVFRILGVQPGHHRAVDARSDSGTLGDGAGTLVLEPPTEVYEPSPGEVELALTYVDCADEIDFVPRLLALQRGPREQVLDELGPQLDEVTRRLEEALVAVSQ